MVRTVNHAPDAQFSSAVTQYIDLTALFKEIAAENFIAEQDGIIGNYAMNNFFLYRLMSRVGPVGGSNKRSPTSISKSARLLTTIR